MIRDTIYSDSNLLALYQARNDIALLEAINEATIPQRVTTRRDSAWLMNTFQTVVDEATGATEADQILGAMEAGPLPRIRAAFSLLNSEKGLDLSDPQTQHMIGSFGPMAGWTDDLIDRLKAAGVPEHTSQALQELGRDATQTDIDNARLIDRWSAAQTEIDVAKNEYLAGDLSTATNRLQSVVDGLEA